MLVMINFFVSFRVTNSDDKVRSNIVIRSNLVSRYATNFRILCILSIFGLSNI